MKKACYLHSLVPVLPRFHLGQKHINDWILKIHEQYEKLQRHEVKEVEFEQKLRRFTLKEEYIRERFFDCGELGEDWANHPIYHLTEKTPTGGDIHERNILFGKRVREVLKDLYPTHVPEHLIHVTCTGYLSPSPPQVYFGEIGKTINITHAYHMGCYASLPAVRMGMGLSLLEGKEVDVVHTELCSLHLDPSLHTPEQMVVQSLFADGHIKYSIGEENKEGFLIHGIHESLLPDSREDMTWVPGPYGMKMGLSRDVPFKIRDSIPNFVKELCEKSGVKGEEILQKAIFAIHPGGPKIIEMVQKKLELRDEQIKASQKVLFERGNMSSATLPHVWKEILDAKPLPGTMVVSLAFGPGLTFFGAIFEVRAR